MTRYPFSGALAFLVVLTVLLTWPQAVHLGTQVAAHPDPLFSIWRLAWVAHALQVDPRHLFDGNIFYPHLRTLAYSDAMLFEALLSAPWLWVHVNPILVYNLMLIVGIVTSGVGMFLLVRSLTGNDDAALVSAAIFTLAPYRVEHFMHLELQWTVWMPLTLWAVHRTFHEGRTRHGALIGLLLWLQMISGIYYGVFLVIVVAAMIIFLGIGAPRAARRAARPLATGAVLFAFLTAPYAVPYIANARALGLRSPGELANFSARLDSYFLAPALNWLWGWSGNNVTGDELHLFPGVTAVALAICAILSHRRRLIWLYLTLTVITVQLSFGINTAAYRWLYTHVPVFGGFRAPARFGILAVCALAVLAGLGFESLQRRVSNVVGRCVFVATLVMIGLECGSAPMSLTELSSGLPPVYKFLQMADRPVIIEFPLEDWNLAPDYMYWSTTHWASLVNGYSGYVPSDYVDLLATMRSFPDDESIARLRALDVRYILVHEAFYKPAAYADLMIELAERPELVPGGRYRDWLGPTQLFELK